ncbi:MAG: ATP-binding protein, partial [Lachnospiraceae bacterium]|nr:ATP-binding protein [Lachnospiraceae bacterium]
TTGVCVPEKHYMVDITERVAQIRAMVDDGKYFCMNRARQYGKTTTLTALRKSLTDAYVVVSLDFQGVGDAGFQTEMDFTQAFCGLIEEEIRAGLVIPDDIRNQIDEIDRQSKPAVKLNRLFRTLSEWCALSKRPIVLIIDEVDSATNNQVFLDFLAQLRKRYLDRTAKGIPAFQSVILAGVTDVKYLKSKIRDEDQHKVNSPWNIAADFTIDMSLSRGGIARMLDDYAKEHHVEMDIPAVSGAIHDATAGYPYLVSKICKMIDEKQPLGQPDNADKSWTVQRVDAAVNALLKEDGIPLFESLIGKLENYPDLSDAVKSLLMRGESMDYQPYDNAQSQLRMYGFITTKEQKVVIANRIFESLLYDYYLGRESSNEFRSSADSDRMKEDKHLG